MSLGQNLDKVVARHRELGEKLAQADVAASKDFVKLSKEYADLAAVVEAINNLKKVQSEIADLQALLEEPGNDAEMRALAESELSELEERLPDLELGVKLLLLPQDEADEKNAILEVRAGTGGEEAALFGAALFRMYQRYAEARGWKFEIMHINETGIGGYKEAIASIAG
ncbi:MAG: PCRF domain-containing protein, partial [Rhodospirillales bacterium]